METIPQFRSRFNIEFMTLCHPNCITCDSESFMNHFRKITGHRGYLGTHGILIQKRRVRLQVRSSFDAQGARMTAVHTNSFKFIHSVLGP